MVYKVFGIRDVKAGFYNPPFHVKSHGEAERAFVQLVKDPKTTIAQFPNDFDLYFLGEFDDNNGMMASIEHPQLVMNAASALD